MTSWRRSNLFQAFVSVFLPILYKPISKKAKYIYLCCNEQQKQLFSRVRVFRRPGDEKLRGSGVIGLYDFL